MFFVLAARALMGTVMAMERPLEMLRTSLALWAGSVRGEQKRLLTLDLFLTQEEFERLVQNPDVVEAWRQAKLLRASGVLPPQDQPA